MVESQTPKAGEDRQGKLLRSGWEGGKWDGRMDRTTWRDFPRDPVLAPNVLSNALRFTEIKCMGNWADFQLVLNCTLDSTALLLGFKHCLCQENSDTIK